MDTRKDLARQAVLDIAARQHFALSRGQANLCGFGPRRINTAKLQGWLDEPVPGVLTVTAAPTTWEQRVMTLVLSGGGHAVASHRTAARLHELDGFATPANAVVELSVARAFRLDPSVPAVVHHVSKLDPCDITTVRGIPCTDLPCTLADLGSVVRQPKLLRRALTAARRRHLPVERVRATVERRHRPGQAGTGAMLELLDAIPFEGAVPATWFEELVLMCVEDKGLPPIELQYPIVGLDGQIVARTDLAIPSVRLGLEAHSRQFHFGPDAEEHDEDRDTLCGEVGWDLMYLGWYATRSPEQVLAHVRNVVRARQKWTTAAAPEV